MAGDLAFAFSSIESEKEANRLQQERNEHLMELEVFYEAAEGREQRILELKKEIERLKARLEGK